MTEPTHKFHVITSVTLLIITITLILGTLGFGALYYFEPEPLVYGNIPFPVYPESLKAGEAFYFDVELCGPERKEVTMTYDSWLYKIETGEKITLNSGITTSPKGCVFIEKIPKLTPDYITPGTYMLHFDVYVESELTFKVFTYHIKTNRFTITED